LYFSITEYHLTALGIFEMLTMIDAEKRQSLGLTIRTFLATNTTTTISTKSIHTTVPFF